jgi:hypothetical protein
MPPALGIKSDAANASFRNCHGARGIPESQLCRPMFRDVSESIHEYGERKKLVESEERTGPAFSSVRECRISLSKI